MKIKQFQLPEKNELMKRKSSMSFKDKRRDENIRTCTFFEAAMT